MRTPERSFETVHAEPGPRPLWIGVFGPSGGGKTFSSLVLAKGIQSVLGGKIEMIDTESGRGRHYAELFDYEYTAFNPPHGSLDYEAVIEHSVSANKSRIVIIDSFSHEHEGEGGLIEYQEAEVQRLSRGDESKAEQVKMLAWTKPKAARKQLLRSMLRHGTDVVFILCFRADEQSKPVKKEGEKTKVVQMGFMPIAGKPFVYEATVCALLMPGANGVPTWEPENVGEKMMRKLPEQFKEIFEHTKGQPLSEAHGRALAEWAKGGAQKKTAKSLAERADAFLKAIGAAASEEKLTAAWSKGAAVITDLQREGDTEAVTRLQDAKEVRLVALRPVAPPHAPPGEPPPLSAIQATASRLKALFMERYANKALAEVALSEATAGRIQRLDDLANKLELQPELALPIEKMLEERRD